MTLTVVAWQANVGAGGAGAAALAPEGERALCLTLLSVIMALPSYWVIVTLKMMRAAR